MDNKILYNVCPLIFSVLMFTIVVKILEQKHSALNLKLPRLWHNKGTTKYVLNTNGHPPVEQFMKNIFKGI